MRDVYGSYPNVERNICLRGLTVIEAVMLELKHAMRTRVYLRLGWKVRSGVCW